MSTVVYRDRTVLISAVPPGTCCVCDHLGYLLVPCPRDHPDRLTPACGVWDNEPAPGHDIDDRCDTVGCRFAIRRVPCPACIDRTETTG